MNEVHTLRESPWQSLHEAIQGFGLSALLSAGLVFPLGILAILAAHAILGLQEPQTAFGGLILACSTIAFLGGAASLASTLALRRCKPTWIITHEHPHP